LSENVGASSGYFSSKIGGDAAAQEKKKLIIRHVHDFEM
jgi:hypothetical protein